MEAIRVHVIKRPNRDNYSMRFFDPLTGRHVERSAKTTKRREAERLAAQWEADIANGRDRRPSRLTWQSFRLSYEANGTAGLKRKTLESYAGTLDLFETLCSPRVVGDLTTARVLSFAGKLREPYKLKHKRKGEDDYRTVIRTEASVAKHLRQLKAVARWGNRQGFLPTVPVFDMPKRSSGAHRMKGRAIATEEFERMLSATEAEVGAKAADSWKLLLRGLWASGLRLGEALALRWDSQPGCARAILDGHKSVLAFDADSQKSGKVELVPLAPEAVTLLEPHQRSRGYVFEPLRQDGEPMARDVVKASKIIGRIGKRAGVVVDPEKGKTASAHDLRRAFGYRWSRRIMPAQLKELLRHASVDTTLRYYAQQSAQATSAELWHSLGGPLGGRRCEAVASTLQNQ